MARLLYARAILFTWCLLLLLLTLPLGSHAVVIPYDFPDGVYEFTWLTEPRAMLGVHTYFDMPHHVNMTSERFRGLLPLPVRDRSIDCLLSETRMMYRLLPTNMRLDFTPELSDLRAPDDSRRALDMLGNWCELYENVHKDALVVAIVNDMMWYVCNWDKAFTWSVFQQRCAKLELYAADLLVDEKCGQDERGEINIRPWMKTIGRSPRFYDICEFKDSWANGQK